MKAHFSFALVSAITVAILLYGLATHLAAAVHAVLR
jgi:hypothetical protein